MILKRALKFVGFRKLVFYIYLFCRDCLNRGVFSEINDVSLDMSESLDLTNAWADSRSFLASSSSLLTELVLVLDRASSFSRESFSCFS